MEGLFKPHTNSTLVQHYKNQFDAGVDVEFNRTNDACTVAQLLLMFFEELPDPLLSYELFPKFLEFAQKPPPPDDEPAALRDIVANLSYPHMTVLAYLLAFLSQVSEENPIKMGIVNVSCAFFYFNLVRMVVYYPDICTLFVESPSRW